MADWTPAELARYQLDQDQKTATRFPGVLERKLARMSASPLAFLRGSAHLFYKLLAERPDLAAGPPGTGWICGDLHLENFGAFRTNGKKHETGDEPVVFDVNDFDEGVVAPFRLDLLRLSTALVLGGRELGESGRRVITLADRLLEAYAETAFEGRPLPEIPAPVALLLAKVQERTRHDLLAARTSVVSGVPRFVRGDRYADLSADLATKARAAFASYAKTLTDADPERLAVQDVAFRVAGTGSLGCLRIAVLTRGKGGPDGGFLYDMKEELPPASSALLSTPPLAPAERVSTAIMKCLERPPRQLGVTSMDSLSLIARRLAPQEDKLDLRKLAAKDLLSLVAYLGALVGRMHRRSATEPLPSTWSEAERSALLDHALFLAGVHEAAYLAYCRAC